MKRFPLCIASLIVAAQLVWLLGISLYNEYRIATAPHILVDSGYTLNDRLHRQFRFRAGVSDDAVSLEKGAHLFGRSFWWDADWGFVPGKEADSESETKPVPVTCTARPKPSDVTGAVQLKEGLCCDVSVIWYPGEKGVWSYRIEVPGSSVDVLRDGELRTGGSIMYSRISDNGSEVPAFIINPFRSVKHVRDLELRPVSNSTRVETRYFTRYKNEEQLKQVRITAEMALIEGGVPVCVGICIGGIPLKQASRKMRYNSFHLPPVPQND